MFLHFIQISTLAIASFQDFKHREISWFLLPILFLISAIELYTSDRTVIEAFLSGLFVLFILLLTYLFYAAKHKSLRIDFADTLIGWGDILFFFAITPAFNFKNFSILFPLSLVFSLIAHLLVHKLDNAKSIPLVGWQSIFYSFALIIFNV